MKYWWVSQKATFKHEFNGGYLWSPKETKSGTSQFYENMKLISIGDPIVPYANGRIIAVSTAVARAYSAPKPDEFGSAGTEWSYDGGRVDADYQLLKQQVSPKQHLDKIASLLPPKYSPLRLNGNGNQSYLFEITQQLFDALLNLSNHEGLDILTNNFDASL